MQRWEFKQVQRWQVFYMEVEAQHLGSQGWEFVAVAKDGSWLFKRPAPISESEGLPNG